METEILNPKLDFEIAHVNEPQVSNMPLPFGRSHDLVPFFSISGTLHSGKRQVMAFRGKKLSELGSIENNTPNNRLNFKFFLIDQF